MWMMSAFSPFARLPLEYMMMPQATEQYVQVLRVSVVPKSLKGRIAAAYAASTPPNPSAPMVVPARPALAPTKKWRRESSMFKVRLLRRLPPTGDLIYIQSADWIFLLMERRPSLGSVFLNNNSVKLGSFLFT